MGRRRTDVPLGPRSPALRVAGRCPGLLFRAAGGLLILATAVLAAGCRETPKAATRPPEPVKVTRVVQKDVPIYGQWVGTTVGYVTAQIRAREIGRAHV